MIFPAPVVSNGLIFFETTDNEFFGICTPSLRQSAAGFST